MDNDAEKPSNFNNFCVTLKVLRISITYKTRNNFNNLRVERKFRTGGGSPVEHLLKLQNCNFGGALFWDVGLPENFISLTAHTLEFVSLTDRIIQHDSGFG